MLASYESNFLIGGKNQGYKDENILFKTYHDYANNLNWNLNTTNLSLHITPVIENSEKYTWCNLVDKTMVIKEEIPTMDVKKYKEKDPLQNRYVISCNNYLDLSQDRILKTLSIMKSKLITECLLKCKINNIKCEMTPTIKDNIIKAYRKITMYGKKTPFVARFDEYGRRLPDEIKIDTIRGMDLKIIDPSIFGENYLSFEAIVTDIIIKKEDLSF